LTQPDRPAGRGRKLAQSPVKQAADRFGIDVLQPERLDEGVRALLPRRHPALLVVVAYGLLLPRWMLDWPAVAPINVHASLLPRWRGASPIQQSILAGDAETGVSIMRMIPGLDRGPVYASCATAIGAAEAAGALHDRLAAIGAELLVASLPGILGGSLAPRPQDDTAASYAPRIQKSDAVLDWTRPARELERQIRGFNPWPVAEARLADGSRLRIWQAELASGDAAAGTPGAILASGPEGIEVLTADGILRLTRVQPPGGRAMSAGAYLAAHSLDRTAFVGGS
jgi:methionyl-tRNA formyltransferase